MIIGIAGRMGSGKDTVGSIIQYLTLGEEFAKTNADIVADMEHDWYCANKSKFQIKKFAGKLKQVASLITGVPVEMWEDQEFKQGRMPYGWGMTYRELIQKLGTEAMRDGLHKDVWVNALFSDYHPTTNKTTDELFMEQFLTGKSEVTYNYPSWCITDMRFPNEMKAVKERKGVTIRVVRYPKTLEQSRGPKNVETIPFDPTNHKHMSLWKGDISRMHASETALDDAEFDYEIINDGTIEDLIEKVREILINEKLL
jgi:hypothetical protein